MLRKPASIIILSLLVVSALALASSVQPVKTSGTSYIRAGGSIDPPTALTSRGSEVTAQDQPDCWPIFHHDLTHTGYSTSSAPNTNQTLWSYTTGNLVDSSPAVVGGVVYVGSYDGKVYALNAATGAQVWNYTTGSYVDSSPAVAGGLVYVGSGDRKVYALNAATGAFVWSYTAGSWVDSSPAVVGGVVYVGSTDSKVYALNAATGAFVWSYTTGNAVASSPAVAGGLVYVGSYDNRTYALNATTGAHVWSYTTGNLVDSSPAVVGGVVYVGSTDGKVYALNAATGAFVWSYTTGNAVASSPAVAGGLVYVGSNDDKVYALNAATGAQVWNYTTGSYVDSSPAVAGGLVYVGSGDRKVYALNAATGAFVWSYTTGSYVYSSPAVAGGMVYVGSEDHRVYDFGGGCVSTPTGTNVTVTFPPQNVSVTFDNVTSAGFTTLDTTDPPNSLFPSVACVGITTTATYSGNVALKFPYDPDGLSLQDQQAMKIWLWNDSSICWVDLTTGVNTTSHTVYGLSPHLSMFGVTSNLGITGDLAVQGTTTVNIPSAPPAPPHSLAALNYYQINTTKSLSTPINLSLAYNYTNIPLGEEIFTQLWMWNESSASWADITTGVNTADHMVYGSAPHLSMFGVTSLPQPPDGIAVASANCPKTVVCQGYGANINVTISNQGAVPQTNFNVTLFCNATLLGTYHVDQLGIGGLITLNFTLITVGWAKGNYSISAFSHGIGWIAVSRIGDLTGGSTNPWSFVPDGVVDGSDLSIVAKCFGSWPAAKPPLTWNANCDVNNDGVVDGSDLAIVAKHFGEGGP